MGVLPSSLNHCGRRDVSRADFSESESKNACELKREEKES